MLLLNNAEAQASGTTVTNANNNEANSVLLDEAVIGTNMALTFDNANPAHGSNAYKFALTSTATAITYVGWSPTQFGSAVTRVYGSFYFRTNVASIASSIRLVEFRRSGANVGRIGCVNTNQGFQYRIGDTATGTIAGSISANTTYRVEFDVTFGASGAATINLYSGDSTTLLSTGGFSATANGTDIDAVRFGFNTANFSSTSGDFVRLDDLNVNDTGLPGPGPYTLGAQPDAPTFGWGAPRRTFRTTRGPTGLIEVRYPQETVTAGSLTTVDATDSLSFSETADRAPQTFARTVTESLSFADAAPQAQESFSRTASDTLSFSESVAGGRIIARTATDSLTFSETATRAAQAFSRTTTESLTFSEAATRAAYLRSRTTAETLTFSEIATRQAYLRSRTATETLAFSEAATRPAYLRSRTTSETLAFSEVAATGGGGGPRTSADSLTFSESAARAAYLRSRTTSDALTFSESVAKQVIRGRVVTDALTFSEAASRGLLIFARTASDALTFAEVVAGLYQPLISAVGVLEGGLDSRWLIGGMDSSGFAGGLAAIGVEHGGSAQSNESNLAVSLIE